MSRKQRIIFGLIRILIFLVLPSAAAPALWSSEQVGPWEWRDVPKLVAVGDVHGTLDRLQEILLRSGLADADLAWACGTSHLVLCGDLIGRGEYEKDALDLVMRLEEEALAAGGRVYVILGNHDVMNLIRDLRYVNVRNYRDFAAGESPADRESAWEGFRKAYARQGQEDEILREAFDDRYPPGYFARLEAYSPRGVYGSWLMRKPAVLKIDDVVFVHGGLTAKVAELGMDRINLAVLQGLGRIQAWMEELSGLAGFPLEYTEILGLAARITGGGLRSGISGEHREAARRIMEWSESPLFGPDGPFWFRGLALYEETLIQNRINEVLNGLGGRHLVIAHTPSRFGRVSSRYRSKILRTDVGMVYNARVWGFLKFEEGEFRTLGFRDPGTYVIPYSEPVEGEESSSILEQLPPEQLEDFLLKAEIESMLGEYTEEGRHIVIYNLAYRDLKQRAAFQHVDEKRDRRDPLRRLRSYRHMVAAYRISRMLEFEIVPPAVVRSAENREGSLVLFPGTAVNRPWFQTRDQLERALAGMEQQLSDARAFLALLDIEEQNQAGQMLLPKEKRLLMADLTKGFSESPEIREEFLPASGERWVFGLPLSPFLGLKLRELDKKTLRDRSKGLLSNAQIDALLGRRDRLLEISAGLGR